MVMEKARMNSSETEEKLLLQLNDAKIREYAPAIAFSAVVVVCGILGNALSVAFYGFKVPRTSTNIIITVLAIVDIITCIVISDEIVELCFTVTFKNIWGCKAMYFFNHSLVLISIFTLFLVAIDRFRKICRPLAWQYSSFRLKLSFTAIIIFAVLFSARDWVILDVVHVNVTYAERNIRTYYCTHTRATSMATTVTIFHLTDFLTLIVIVVSTAVLYSCIAKKLWKSRKNVRDYKQTANTSELHVASVSEPTVSRDIDITTEDTVTSIEDHVPACEKEFAHFAAVHKDVVVYSDLKNCKIEIDQNKGDMNLYGTEKHVLRKSEQPEKIEYKQLHKDLCGNTTSTDGHEKDVADDKNRNKSRKGGKDVNKMSAVDDKNSECRRVKKRPPEAGHIERKVTLMMFTINVAFLVSFIPYFIVSLWIKQQSNSSTHEFNSGIQIALRSYMLNNAINPYIIGLFNSNFRKFVKLLLCD